MDGLLALLLVGPTLVTLLAALAEAREAFLPGTSRDVQPIRSVDGALLPAVPGPVTRKAADIFVKPVISI